MYLLATVFHFCTYSREIIDKAFDLTKALTLAFWWTLFKGSLSNLRDYNFACGLAMHTRFGYLDLVFKVIGIFKVTGMSES